MGKGKRQDKKDIKTGRKKRTPVSKIDTTKKDKKPSMTFEPYDSEEDRIEQFEESIELEIENGIKQMLEEKKENDFFEFTKTMTSDLTLREEERGFDRLLENYKVWFIEGMGKRGTVPKVKEGQSDLYDRYLKMLETLNKQKEELESKLNKKMTEEEFLRKLSKTPASGRQAITVKRIINARLEKIDKVKEEQGSNENFDKDD